MANKKKGQLTQTKSWDKHLRKIGKRIFWKTERPAEKKMIEQNLAEIDSAEKLYEYLNNKLPHSLTYEDLHNLYYSLFCTLDILPDNLKSLELTKEVLAFTFAKLSTRKNITELISNDNITDENHWIEQIAIFMRADEWPNHENARKLIETN